MVFRRCLFLAALVCLGLLLAACTTGKVTPSAQVATLTPTQLPPTLAPTPTPTPLPSPTPVPLAATVNGEGITLAEFEAEAARYQAALALSGTNLATLSATGVITDVQARVLADMIDQVLLAQGATQAGFNVDDALVQARLEALAVEMGGTRALEDWQAANHYTPESFRTALARSIAVAWMRDQVVAAVPAEAEQVHARQILLLNEDQADQVYALLQSGQDFETLAADYDPLTGGELGWFPQGYLNERAVEEAAFALQPGEYSPVITTRLGYHILQVIEREAAHPLDPEARYALQTAALQAWLVERRAQSNLEIFIP